MAFNGAVLAVGAYHHDSAVRFCTGRVPATGTDTDNAFSGAAVSWVHTDLQVPAGVPVLFGQFFFGSVCQVAGS